MEIRKLLIPRNKYPIKAPYAMDPEFYIVHNTANDAAAYNEISYMTRNENKVSFHYAIDDREIVQGIPENRNSWNAGDGGSGQGNRKGIAIEICYSKSGGPRFDKAEQLAAKFIAQGLMDKGWGIDKVKKHQDFSGKYCPHRTLDKGWDRFLGMINDEMEAAEDLITIRINGREVKVVGKNEGGNTSLMINGDYIDIRDLGTYLGYKVGWDNLKKAVTWND